MTKKTERENKIRFGAFPRGLDTDRRLPKHSTVLKPLVDAVHSVDPTGQAFRYHSSARGSVHLANTAVIHLRSLEKTFLALRGALDDLDSELEFLSQEYFAGTYTAKLSRADLVAIAEDIRKAYAPLDKSWMTRLRTETQARYGLSRSEFDAADSLIESKTFLSYKAGVELPLEELSVETMSILIWALIAFPEDELLSEIEWAGLAGVADIIRPWGYPEFYDWEVERYMKHNGHTSKGDVARLILRRPEEFANALKRLGQPTLARAFLETWSPEIA